MRESRLYGSVLGAQHDVLPRSDDRRLKSAKARNRDGK
jgi:hypothetical protein